MVILLAVKTSVVSAQAGARLRLPLQLLPQMTVRNSSASTIPSVSTVSTKPRPKRKDMRPNTPASLIALSTVNATTRSPSGSPSVGIATIGGMKMTGVTHARQTIATTFSRSFSLPRIRVDVLSAMTFGTASRSMNVITMALRVGKRVTKQGETATDVKTMAGKFEIPH